MCLLVVLPFRELILLQFLGLVVFVFAAVCGGKRLLIAC
jgi:hypothetical protein